MNPNMSKSRIFSWFFVRKSPIFSLKIEILKIQKHRHVAEDVFYHTKPSNGNSHAHPKRSVGAVWGHPSFSAIQNGRQSAILYLITRQIMVIVTLTYIPSLISISDQLRQFWRRYNMKCAKNCQFLPIFSTPGGHLEFFQNSKITGIYSDRYFMMSQSFVKIQSAISELWGWTDAHTHAHTDGRRVFLYPPLGPIGPTGDKNMFQKWQKLTCTVLLTAGNKSKSNNKN